MPGLRVPRSCDWRYYKCVVAWLTHYYNYYVWVTFLWLLRLCAIALDAGGDLRSRTVRGRETCAQHGGRETCAQHRGRETCAQHRPTHNKHCCGRSPTEPLHSTGAVSRLSRAFLRWRGGLETCGRRTVRGQETLAQHGRPAQNSTRDSRASGGSAEFW